MHRNVKTLGTIIMGFLFMQNLICYKHLTWSISNMVKCHILHASETFRITFTKINVVCESIQLFWTEIMRCWLHMRYRIIINPQAHNNNSWAFHMYKACVRHYNKIDVTQCWSHIRCYIDYNPIIIWSANQIINFTCLYKAITNLSNWSEAKCYFQQKHLGEDELLYNGITS